MGLNFTSSILKSGVISWKINRPPILFWGKIDPGNYSGVSNYGSHNRRPILKSMFNSRIYNSQRILTLEDFAMDYK